MVLGGGPGVLWITFYILLMNEDRSYKERDRKVPTREEVLYLIKDASAFVSYGDAARSAVSVVLEKEP